MSFAPSRLSARCLTGNGFGAIPLHLIDSDGCFRGSHPFRDAAGIAAAGLAGQRVLVDIEAAYLPASRNGDVSATMFAPSQRWTAAAFGLVIRALRGLASSRGKPSGEAHAADPA